MAAPSGTQWGSIVGGLGKLGIYTKITETATDVTVKVQVWLATKGPCCEDFYRNGSGNLAYKVQAGDGFHKIAYKLGLGTNSGHVIANYNGMSINDTILVGQELLIPPNTFYYNAGPNVTSASTRIGPIYVQHKSSTEWSTSNQTLLYEYEEYRHNKSASDVVHKVFAKLTDAPYAGGTLSASATYTVQKLKAYTIKFNANGGTGGPSTLTKYHGIGLDIPSTVPTRTGYSFLGWCDSDSYLEGNPLISPGDVYYTEENAIFTAIWKQVEFTITFDANGGTDAPATQTKCYGTGLSLKDVGVPSKTYHNFLGWSLSPYSTDVKYKPEDAITENQSVTLYAVWEVAYVIPQIRNAKASRCNAEGVLTDEGTYAKVTFDWECYEPEDAPGGSNEGQSIKYAYVETGVNTWPDDEDLTVMTINGLSGKADIIIGNDELDIEKSYSILVQVHDRVSMSDITLTISDLKFPIDVLARNKGVSFGKPATRQNAAEVAYTLKPLGNRYSASSRGTAGTAGFVKIAKITLAEANANWPITFVLTSRLKMSPMTVHVRFKSSLTNGVVSGSVDTIRYEGSNYNAYVSPEVDGGSVWYLYVQKASNTDTITIQDWWMSSAMETRCRVSFFETDPQDNDIPDTLYNQVPTPYHKATPLVPQHVLDSFFPVGYVLILFSHANPNDMYPGTTWVRINNAFLWACDDKGTIDGTIMGSKTKTLTVENLPAHNHKVYVAGGSTSYGSQKTAMKEFSKTATGYIDSAVTESTGNGEALNIMPPYVQVAVWRRTA